MNEDDPNLEMVRKRAAELKRKDVARWLDDAPVGMDDIAEKIWIEYTQSRKPPDDHDRRRRREM